MNRLERHRQNLQRRMMASAAIYVVFAVVALVAGVRGTTFDDPVLMPIIALLLASIGVLPRSAVPRQMPTAETPEQADQLEMMRNAFLELERRATYQRFFYFAIAVLLIAVLPLLGI